MNRHSEASFPTNRDNRPRGPYEQLAMLFATLHERSRQKSQVGNTFQQRRMYSQKTVDVAIEHAREAVVTHLLTMDISYDQALLYLKSIGVGTQHAATEDEWIEMLGLAQGAVVEVGSNGRKRRTVYESGMTLNKSFGPEVKPYAWYKTLEGDLNIVGARFAIDGLGACVRVVSRGAGVASRQDGHAVSE